MYWTQNILNASAHRLADKSEFGGIGRSEKSGGVILNQTRSPDGEVTDKSEFEESNIHP